MNTEQVPDPVAGSEPHAQPEEGALLRVEDLRIAFGGGRAPARALRGVSFELPPGEVLGLVGESGSGKSVTAQAILGVLPEPPAQITGRVIFDGRDLRTLPKRELRRLRGADMAMVFQDVAGSLNPVRTVGSQLAEPLRVHRELGRRAARERAVEMLDAVGIPSPRKQLDAYPHQLSGGMRQRVMIAMALSCEPRLLLVDEATTALDVSIQAQILELLRSVVAQSSTAMIVISHDLSVVAGIADRVAVMYAGRLVEDGAVEPLFAHPRHPYTLGLLGCAPRVDGVRRERLSSISGSPPDPLEEPPGCAFAPRCGFVMSRCRHQTPALEPKAPAQAAACFAQLDDEARSPAPAERPSPASAPDAEMGAPLLELRNLRVHFNLGRGWLPWQAQSTLHAVEGVTLTVARGETLGLVGESGSGKSTIARAILQVERPTEGEVILDGRNLAELSKREMRLTRRRIQLISQESESALDPHATIGAALAEPLIVQRLATRRELDGRVRELLDAVGLPAQLADRYPHELSGGQRQRVNISRALATRPEMLVADEPTSALDVSVRAQIINLLADLKRQHELTYVIISHDLSVVRHISDRVAVAYLGHIVELADRDRLFADPRHPYTRALLSVVPVPDPTLARRRPSTTIPGEIPSPVDPPTGCPFHTRCPLAFERCTAEKPALRDVGGGHHAACFLAD